jgi:hypothetical protein
MMSKVNHGAGSDYVIEFLHQVFSVDRNQGPKGI